jgi:hypothetical protein
MTDRPSILRVIEERWMRLADRVFGDTGEAAGETARGEFTSAFISEKSLADYLAREDVRRNARRPPAP